MVHSEVHEFYAKLALDLGLSLDGVLNDHAHLLNSVHFGLLGNMDPVLEHLVEVQRGLTSVLELLEGPVSDLDQAEAKNRFLDLDGLSHLLNIDALFNTLVFLDRGSTLLILALSSRLFGV